MGTERQDASLEKVIDASSPQAPKDSTTRGIQLQPSLSQILEFSRCLCCSVAAGAEPPICPALETMSGFIGEDIRTDKRKPVCH